MFRKPWTSSISLLTVASLVILADQGSKFLVARGMELGQSVSVLGNFFRLTFIRNTGGVFGIFLGGGWFYLVASLLAIIVIWYYFRRVSAGSLWTRMALAGVLGGALGNLTDRLRYGAVTDFLDFGIGQLRWPVFNLADAAVTVGVALFLLNMLWSKREGGDESQTPERSQPE